LAEARYKHYKRTSKAQEMHQTAPGPQQPASASHVKNLEWCQFQQPLAVVRAQRAEEIPQWLSTGMWDPENLTVLLEATASAQVKLDTKYEWIGRWVLALGSSLSVSKEKNCKRVNGMSFLHVQGDGTFKVNCQFCPLSTLARRLQCAKGLTLQPPRQN